MAELDLTAIAAGSIATPASGVGAVYIDSTTKRLASKNDAGTVSDYADLTSTQTLAGKTLTTPNIGAATGTSLAATGAITSSSPSAGIGYATGAGIAPTQATSKSTTVAANGVCGTITMDGAALNAGVLVSFTFTNTSIAANDHVIITHDSVGTIGGYTFNVTPGAGTATVNVRNITAGNLSEAIKLRFTVIKGVVA